MVWKQLRIEDLIAQMGEIQTERKSFIFIQLPAGEFSKVQKQLVRSEQRRFQDR